MKKRKDYYKISVYDEYFRAYIVKACSIPTVWKARLEARKWLAQGLKVHISTHLGKRVKLGKTLARMGRAY